MKMTRRDFLSAGAAIAAPAVLAQNVVSPDPHDSMTKAKDEELETACGTQESTRGVEWKLTVRAGRI
jgi:hypothetical protein